MAFNLAAKRSSPLCRRQFLLASAAFGATLLLPGAARSATVRHLEGSVSVNGKAATRATRVRPGDLVETGPDSKLVLVLGQDAFLLRERSGLKLERPTSGDKAAIAKLRLEAGALVAAFGKGSRVIETATAIAITGARPTGVYLEASPEQTYFCTCYGETELRHKASGQRKLVVSTYHTSNIIYAQAVAGGLLVAAAVQDHSDAELIMLDGLVGRTSPVVARQRIQKSATAPQQSEPSQPAASTPVSIPEAPPKPETPAPNEALRLPPARLSD
jgi:hypothetical protein